MLSRRRPDQECAFRPVARALRPALYRTRWPVRRSWTPNGERSEERSWWQICPPDQPRPALMLLYNIVAELRQFRGARGFSRKRAISRHRGKPEYRDHGFFFATYCG